jgi:YD repeat-containing protein
VGGSGNDLVQTTDYTVNDNITTTSTSATGTYIVDTAYQQATRSGSATGTIQALTQSYYDGATSLTAAPPVGDVWKQAVAYSGTAPNFSFLTTLLAHDSYGNLIGIQQPNGQTGACTLTLYGTPTGFSSCATYDTSSYTAHVLQVTNALGQHTLTRAYGSGSTFGYGEWAQSATDANSQATTYQYDVFGRLTGIAKPGEGTNLETLAYAYLASACPATGPSIPCGELDTTQRFDSSTTVTSKVFYDGWGKVAETRTPADSANDVVVYTTYDAREETIFTSNPYYVSNSTSGYSAPDTTKPGASAVYDALGRQTQATDPIGNSTTTSYLQMQWIANGPYYEGTLVIDANSHQTVTLTDALGRTTYLVTYTGTSSPYTWYSTTTESYDFQGNLASITHPDGIHTSAFSHDLAGRQVGSSEPDLGTITDLLDSDGNVIQETDARGQAIYAGYDALDRQLWRNTSNSPTGAYVTYSYDGTVPSGVSCSGITPGSNSIGHVTTEQFTSGPNNSFNGSYCYAYDARGELLGQVDTLAGATYLPTLYAYNDAGVVTTLTFPTTQYEQFNFSPQERLTSISRHSGTTNYLIPKITYNGAAGAAGQPDSYVVGGTGSCASANASIVCASLSYDNDLRLTHVTFTHPITSTTSVTYYDLGRTFDTAGNVTSVSSAMPSIGSVTGGQDNQQFCYDALNRLTWAGNSGTNPCTNTAVTGTTIPNTNYTASFQYDTSTRLTQSTLTGALASQPQGSYTYDATNYHAVDGIGSGAYAAWHDASGNMTCRTPQRATGL